MSLIYKYQKGNKLKNKEKNSMQLSNSEVAGLVMGEIPEGTSDIDRKRILSLNELIKKQDSKNSANYIDPKYVMTQEQMKAKKNASISPDYRTENQKDIAKRTAQYVENPGIMDYIGQAGYMPLLALSNPFTMGEKLKELRAINSNNNTTASQKFDQSGNIGTEASQWALLNAATDGAMEGVLPAYNKIRGVLSKPKASSAAKVSTSANMGELTNYMNKVDNINKTGVNFQEDDFAKAFQQSERANMKAKLQKLDELDNFNISDDEMKKAFQQIERQELKKKLQRLSEEDIKSSMKYLGSKEVTDKINTAKKVLSGRDKIKKDNIGELKDFNISDAEIKKAVTLNERDALKKKLQNLDKETEQNIPKYNNLNITEKQKAMFDELSNRYPGLKSMPENEISDFIKNHESRFKVPGMEYGFIAAGLGGAGLSYLTHKEKQTKPAIKLIGKQTTASKLNRK